MIAPRPTRFEVAALGAGVAGIAACLGGLAGDRGALALSYLAAYLFWSGVSIGALALVMIHQLTGGQWGEAIRRPLSAAIRALPLAALLFVPIAVALSTLYVWARPDALAASELLQRKAWYLNTAFFFGRAGVYFVVWIGLGLVLARRRADAQGARALGRWSAGGLILYAITTSFAGVDWFMTLMPEWYSSIFGMLVGVGDALSALAFAIVAAMVLPGADGRRAEPKVRRDLGNVLLVLVLLWGYLAYMEYLTTWAGNQPHVIAWYVPRVETDWRWLGVFLMLFHFFVPLLLLLSRRAKASVPVLCGLAAWMLFARWADTLWMVVPSIDTDTVRLRWTDAAAVLGIGGLWLAAVAWQWRVLGPAATLPASSVAHGDRRG
jgi:hypothetical protein